MKLIAYYRVSTDKQGRSGLGLEAQRTAIDRYVDATKSQLVGAFSEIESGKRTDRPQLCAALGACRLHQGVLVIAKLDRLARNAAFLLNLRDSGVEFVACDMPDANRLTVGIMALMAEYEREMISQRTKAALASAKARGTPLGGFRGHIPSAQDRLLAAQVKRNHVSRRDWDLKLVISAMQARGLVSLRQISRALNDEAIPAPRGGVWHPQTVGRVLKRIQTA